MNDSMLTSGGGSGALRDLMETTRLSCFSTTDLYECNRPFVLPRRNMNQPLSWKPLMLRMETAEGRLAGQHHHSLQRAGLLLFAQNQNTMSSVLGLIET